MGRRKLEIKRIENKSSRLVSFSKRRTGLIKKARNLSVLCEADVAVVVFSDSGKLYEFGSSGSNSVAHLLSRYEKARLEPENNIVEGDCQELLQCKKFRTCKELLQAVDRLVEENNNNNNNEERSAAVTDMTQLEEELHAALMQARSRKTQLMMEYVLSVQEEVRSLNKEKEDIEKQIASAEHAFREGDNGYNDLAAKKMNSPQHFTLSLF